MPPFSLRLLILFYYLFVGCNAQNPTSGKEEAKQGPSQTVRPYTPGARIAWDYRTLTLIDPDPASYPRMIRLNNGNLLVAYEEAGAKVRISRDDGAIWDDEIMVQPNQNGIVAANPELLQLQNGDILLAYNERPYNNLEARFAIRVKISKDGGQTWSDLSTVYQGGLDAGRGVWEPVMLQLPNGEIQLYFANEYPYPDNNDQEISLCRSVDNGATWSNAQTVSYRLGHRDGMPVPILLNNQELVMTIEDSGIDPTERRLKPAVIRSSAGSDWPNAPVDGQSSNRWRALAPDWQLPDGAKGGAPYIDQFPNGETVLSFQSQLKYRAGTAHILPEPTRNMLVGMGSPRAQHFHSLSAPFEVESGEVAVWGSMLVKDAKTITAVTTTNAYNKNGDYNQVYAIDGHRIPEMTASRAEVMVDGKLDEQEWSGEPQNFIRAYSRANTDIYTRWDETNFFAAFTVRDQQVTNNSVDPMQDDGVVLYLAPDSLSYDAPVSGAYKVIISSDGTPAFYEGDTETHEWRIREPEGIMARATETEEGYNTELAISWDILGGRPGLNEEWGFNAGLINDDGGTVQYEELSGSRKDRPSTWSGIELVR